MMKVKIKLKDSKGYEKVYIEHDLSIARQQRLFNSNMIIIVNAINRNKIQVEGSRVNLKIQALMTMTSINNGMHMKIEVAKKIGAEY